MIKFKKQSNNFYAKIRDNENIKTQKIFGFELTNLGTYIRLSLQIKIEYCKIRSRTRRKETTVIFKNKLIATLPNSLGNFHDRIGQLKKKVLIFYLRITNIIFRTNSRLD